MAEPIGLIEKFALAEDREEWLEGLIPGSEDYFFYHCLHFQVTEQLDEAESVIKDWLASHKGRETPAIIAMIDRQRLLSYGESPDRTIKHLIDRLGVNLNHAPPAIKGERRFPSRLNPDILNADKLVKETLRGNGQLTTAAVQYAAELFLSNKNVGLRMSLRDFLNRVDGPYLLKLDQLVIKELASRRERERKFGDLQAHRFLTLAELQNVATRVPIIADDNAFVRAVLQRLRPNADSDPSQQADVRLDYLKRVENYTQSLPASYNSLKAASIYRLLEANLAVGRFDRDMFLRYLKLPRNSAIVHPIWLKSTSRRANLNEDFMAMALLPPIGDERSLVRVHLEHFLKDAKDTSAFAQYLQPDYLRKVFAETKLLYGVGDPATWYELLSPSERQAIRDRTELRLATQNRLRYSADEPTTLLVDIKNVDELVIRTYQINTLAYHQNHERRLDTDIDLDGLVATDEEKVTFDQSAIRRHRETLQLNQISGRGIWVVDLVGKDLRARAMIRRGEIHYVNDTTADGMQFTIVDENRSPLPKATMLVGSREFVADEKGRIVFPPVKDSVSRRAIISDGALSELVSFKHLQENYQLSASFHLDRSLVQSGSEAEVLVRPRLSLLDTPVAIETLQDVSVKIIATDLDNVSTTSEFDDVQVSQAREIVVPLRVPNRLASLKVVISGKVRQLSTSKEVTLHASHTFQIASIRTTNQIHDAFLTRDGNQYVIEVRGRSGEPVPFVSVNVNLRSRFRPQSIGKTLQSDENGQVHLTQLSDVESIQYSVAGGITHSRDLRLNSVQWRNAVHTVTDQTVRLPLESNLNDVRKRFRLVDIRGEAYHQDRSDKLSAKDGLLEIDKLDAGDYRLVDRRTGKVTTVKVVQGPQHGLVAVGKIRHHSIASGKPVGIASIDRTEEGLKIQLSGETRFARVHLYVSRYLDSPATIHHMDLPVAPLYSRRVTLPQCGYVSDLRLGEEYQYVLRRRYATKYPDVMLPQAGLILNPWETKETSNTIQAASGGEAPPASSAAPADVMRRENRAGKRKPSAKVSSDFDFLADPGALVSNLHPDENGVVIVPNDVIGGMPIVRVVVMDPVNLLQRVIGGPLRDPELLDLRLAETLDVKRPLTFERTISVIGPKNPLNFKNLGSAQLQVYGSVGSLMKLYQTLVGDDRLADFDSLAVWHTLDRDAKLEVYSRLACHELHLFLWSYDRKFFDQIVKPYLMNKKEKQFIDDWLLDNDLRPYTRLWRYNELNVAERALLGIRLDNVSKMVRRELDELVDLQRVNPDLRRQRIENALALNGLGFFGDVKAVAESESLSRRSLALGATISAMGSESRKSSRLSDAKKMSQSLEDEIEMEESLLPGEMMDGAALFGFAGRAMDIQSQPAFYRELDVTKQWAESHWDRVRTVGGSNPSILINSNAFWADFATSQSAAEVSVSQHLLEPVENRHAALVAIAFCGLPTEAGEIGLPTEPDKVYQPEHPVAVVTKRLRPLEQAEGDSSILIGQRFAPIGQKTKPNETPEEPKEFLTGTGYQGQIVISNPTAARRQVDVFWQIPAGAIPLGGSQFTDSKTILLEPFAVKSIHYTFYFPSVGDYTHYPATVAQDGKLVSRGGEKLFKAVAQASEDDTVTWEKIARHGTAAEIRAYLKTANLRELDWLLVAHRMQDQEVYQVIIKTLNDANLIIPELWAYSLEHRDTPSISSFLSVDANLVDRVGPVLECVLLSVEPIKRRTHEILEYAPLVRARVHRLGQENEILNPTFLGQYQSFVRTLAFDREIDSTQHFVLVYYLLLQNRIDEAIKHFSKVDRDSISTKLQYDYASAYLAMCQEDFATAEEVAIQYTNHPIPRWASRFAELGLQLRQRKELMHVEELVSDGSPEDSARDAIKEGSGDLSLIDREKSQQKAADIQPEVMVRVEGNMLRIDHRQASEVRLNFYGVDLELLFSKAPFVREDLQRMAMVQPTQSKTLKFASESGISKVAMDDDLIRKTLLVEVIAGASRSTALYYGGQITTYVSESFGQLQTSDSRTQLPVRTAYVKVFARYPDGSVKFYKDGYTDSRGRFDYASISASDAKGATRFAILVLSDDKGATLHDVATPSQ